MYWMVQSEFWIDEVSTFQVLNRLHFVAQLRFIRKNLSFRRLMLSSKNPFLLKINTRDLLNFLTFSDIMEGEGETVSGLRKFDMNLIL